MNQPDWDFTKDRQADFGSAKDPFTAYGSPILVDVDNDGREEILVGGCFGGFGVLRDDFSILWWMQTPFTDMMLRLPGIADVQGDGRLCIGICRANGIFSCLEGTTGRVLWNIDLQSTTADIVSCDIDGDGKEEFIAGTTDGRLLAIGTDTSGRGVIRWSVDIGCALGNPVVADADGDGFCEVLCRQRRRIARLRRKGRLTMRNVRIGTTAFLVEDSPHTIDMNIERAVGYIALAKAQGADILCLPEMVTTANVPKDLEYHAEEYPGEITAGLPARGACAQDQRHCPVSRPFGKEDLQPGNGDRQEREDRRFLSQDPADGGGEPHVTPGNELPVFELDFGRIAVMICMDIYFPEIPRIYAFKGAEILFWPTVSHGPTQEALRTQLTARAVDNSLIVAEANLANHPPYAAYAGRYRPATARIIDHNGDILAQTGRRHGVATATVDLDEVRLTSQCVLIREPDRMREDLESITRLDLYAREYAGLSRKQKRYY